MRGDTVPGVGRIDLVVRWGNRWVVSTTSGLIARILVLWKEAKCSKNS